jgi:hypothetical protein
MRSVVAAIAALLAAAALVVYGVEHEVAHPVLTVQANERKVFRPDQAPAGTKVVCVTPGSRVFARVEPRSKGVVIFADGVRYSSSLSLDTKRNGSVSAWCR